MAWVARARIWLHWSCSAYYRDSRASNIMRLAATAKQVAEVCVSRGNMAAAGFHGQRLSYAVYSTFSRRFVCGIGLRGVMQSHMASWHACKAFWHAAVICIRTCTKLDHASMAQVLEATVVFKRLQ